MKPTSLFALLVSDAIGFIALTAIALFLGLTVNHFRMEPLSLSFSYSENKSSFPEITLPDLQQLTQSHSAHVIDARPAAFFALGHIPTAINLPLDEIERQKNPEEPALPFSQDDVLIVYCSDISCPVAQSAAQVLKTLGYTHVKIFPGGWYAWKKAGLPIERNP